MSSDISFGQFDFGFVSKIAATKPVVEPRTCQGVRGKSCRTRFVPQRESHVQCHHCFQQEKTLEKQDYDQYIAACIEWAQSLFEANAMPEGVRVTKLGVEAHVSYGGIRVFFRSATLQRQLDEARAAAETARQERELLESPARQREVFRKTCTEWARTVFESGRLEGDATVKVTVLNAQVSVAFAGVSVTFISEWKKEVLALEKAEASRKAAAERTAREKVEREAKAERAKLEAAQPKVNKAKGKNGKADKADRKGQRKAA